MSEIWRRMKGGVKWGIPDEGEGCETGLIILRCEDCATVILTMQVHSQIETLGLLCFHMVILCRLLVARFDQTVIMLSPREFKLQMKFQNLT